MKILLNPRYINNLSKSSPQSYRTVDSNTSNTSNILRLTALQKSLLNVQIMLKEYNQKNEEPSVLEYQIRDLLNQISYVKASLVSNNAQKTKNQNQKKSLMDVLLAEDIKNINLSDYEREAQSLINNAHKILGIEPVGKDLLIASTKSKLPKPFELSDKLLTLDEYQNKAVQEFKNGNTVLVTAPTGTGKTLIAEHIIDDILKSGKKVIYTTPLKALCNDKYKQFSILWGDYNNKGELIGKSKIGLATGDAKINVNAPLVVMTTEIYRNMLIQQGEKAVEKELKDVDAVIFDEFHYMGDTQRGSVWEEAVMFSPHRMRFLMLSATIANANPIKEWLVNINNNHSSEVINVPEDERHVPLKHYVYSSIDNIYDFRNLIDDKIDINALKTKNFNKRERETLSELSQKIGCKTGIEALEKIFSNMENSPNMVSSASFIRELVKKYNIPYQKAEQYALRLADKSTSKLNPNLSKMSEMKYVSLEDIIGRLNRKNMVPALYFTYSKRSCKNLMQEGAEKVGQLLTPEERSEIQKRILKIEQKGIFLGTDFEDEIKPCLLKGFAMHHSGMLPQCKSFIEELGRSKLVKVCFATDTLGAGINFPFKTVVFSDFEKYGDFGFEEISVNSFKQGAGRAGRRGIDDIGYVISIPKSKEELIIPYNKVTQPSDEIQSAFKLSYGLILSPRFLNNSIKILNNSFDNFQKKSYDYAFRKSMLMKDLLKERKFVEQKNNKFQLTPKGKIAAKVRGINEILLAEILTNNSLMENIKPEELAGLISMFAPDKEEKIVQSTNLSSKKYNQRIQDTISLAQIIRDKETEKRLESNIMINNTCSQAVKLWASLGGSEENKELWASLVSDLLSEKAIKAEGDFLKKINYTTNVLKQIKKIAPSPYIQDVADKAVKMLQKSPVNDILLYELDYKENNE